MASSYILSPANPITFQYENVVGVETYSWPSTLISYPVEFTGDIRENDLVLTNMLTGKEEIFQLSGIHAPNGVLRSANVSFMAELPYAGQFRYQLSVSKNANKITSFDKMPVSRTSGVIEVKGNNIHIRLPQTQTIQQNQAPAPLLSLNQGSGWIGDNKILSPAKNIISLQSETVEHGPLFIQQNILYTFENGGTYLAAIKLVKDYPFVIIDETMNALSGADKVTMDMEWTGFQPAKRFGTQWDRNLESEDVWIDIDKPVYTSYSKEDPRWTGMGWIEDPTDKMIFRLTSFGGNSVREQTPVMSFWEEKGQNRELGIFVYDFNRWNDRQYGIWQPTPTLSVYFRYAGDKLYFTYPLIEGTRSTAISFFNEKDGINEVNAFNARLKTLSDNGGKHNPKDLYYRYSQRLLMQYSSLSLDKIKDWQLTYPQNGKRPANPFTPRPKGSKEEFIKQMSVSAMAYYPMGLNYYPGIHSIEHRVLYTNYVEDYLRFYQELSDAERQMAEALFFLAGYVNTLEEMNAIRNSLAGTANMAADGWAVPPQIAFLFPEHTMAGEWMDFFEKTLEIYGLFYTRPEVKQYQSKAGRWAESLGIYNWAFLRPTSHSNIAGELYDGKNRFASPYMAQRGQWMLDMLTAPIDGKGRCFPPHGAHSSGYLVPRYLPMYQTAEWLKNYDPLLAEHLFWTGTEGEDVEKKPADTDWHVPYKKMHARENNGTNPHLKSTKYTGQGIVLRAAVDTPEELSIHLNQVDKGPNYRWGNQGEGNTGGLYFYAKGKVYTAHENEIAGDHIVNNLDGLTNFGVMKNGEYRTIGMNELKAPLYDFGCAQFAELLSDDGKDKYVWPDYISRSVMLAGNDYFILFDEVGTNWRAAGRFAWFNRDGQEFPKIIFLSDPARKDSWMKAQTPNANGFYRDNFGSLLTLVTHKKEEVFVEGGQTLAVPFLENANIADYKADKNLPKGVIRIKTSNSNDIVFRNDKEIKYNSEAVQKNTPLSLSLGEGAQRAGEVRSYGVSFQGKAGLIRQFTDGTVEMSLFKGTEISAGGVSINIKNPGQSAISLVLKPNGEIYGILKTNDPVDLSITTSSKGNWYVNGCSNLKSPPSGDLGGFSPGEYKLEYTKSRPTPIESRIVSAEYEKGRVKLYIENESPCENLQIETSTDGGKTWKAEGKTSKTTFYLSKNNNPKIHVRAVAMNGKKQARTAPEYPVYFTDELPHYPEGLWLKPDADKVELSWGEVFGTQEYRLYRRVKGAEQYELVYKGKEQRFIDQEVYGVRPAFDYPGKRDHTKEDYKGIIIYEYAVTAVNGNGESLKSPAENTDPASWRNWYPHTELRYKRQSAFWMPPYVYPEMVPEKYYPE